MSLRTSVLPITKENGFNQRVLLHLVSLIKDELIIWFKILFLF